MNKLRIGLGILVLLMVGCGGNKLELKSDFDIPAPTVLKSINDFPKQITSRQDILKTGVIRVISESGKNQNQYEALEASRIEAQRDILAVIKGAELDSSETVSLGILTKDEITRVISGHLRTFSCGNFYDTVKKVGYSCQESIIK
jgi:hypothetical protein